MFTFYKNAWDIVGNEVVGMVMEFISSSRMLTSINCNTITLVLKIPCPIQVGDFRPIMFCTVLYKITSKVLPNTFKVALPSNVRHDILLYP